MPSAFSQQLIDQAGPVDGYLHIDPVALDTATTLATTFVNVSKYEPWEHDKTKVLVERHPVAVWRSLSCKISSREGSFGRMVTLYCGWSSNGASAPRTVRDMANLKGSFMRTFGGTGDPGMFSVVLSCPFDGTMTDTLAAPYNGGVRPVFYYCFTEVELTATPPDAMRAMLEFNGHYDVFGRF